MLYDILLNSLNRRIVSFVKAFLNWCEQKPVEYYLKQLFNSHMI